MEIFGDTAATSAHFHVGGWSLRIRSIFHVSLVVALRQCLELPNTNRQSLVRTVDLLPKSPWPEAGRRSEHNPRHSTSSATHKNPLRKCDLVRSNLTPAH